MYNARAVVGVRKHISYDLREAVRTLEDLAPTTRRVMGGAHPTTEGVESDLQNARDALHARETPPRGT